LNNLYVRQANLKVILELTGSQCSSLRRALAGSCERLGETTRATEVCTRCNFLMSVEPWIREFAQSIRLVTTVFQLSNFNHCS